MITAEQKRRAALYRMAAERIAAGRTHYTCVAISHAAQLGADGPRRIGMIPYQHQPDAAAWVSRWGCIHDDDLMGDIHQHCPSPAETPEAMAYRQTLLCFAAAMTETGDF